MCILLLRHRSLQRFGVGPKQSLPPRHRHRPIRCRSRRSQSHPHQHRYRHRSNPTTGSDGSYLFDLVQVGTYKLTVDKPGFSIFLQDGIVLELNQNGRLDVALKIGQENQTVEVASNVVQVDTTGAVLGKVENQRMINDLPLG